MKAFITILLMMLMVFTVNTVQADNNRPKSEVSKAKKKAMKQRRKAVKKMHSKHRTCKPRFRLHIYAPSGNEKTDGFLY